MEWSKNVITPRDRAEIVDVVDELQIELMGTQAVASANTYFQASLVRLRKAHADLIIAERDRDRYLASSEAHFAKFREVERELVEGKEKVKQLEMEVKRLEMEVTRSREQVLAEYKSSQEFKELLDVEYDRTFPETFTACWEKIITKLGSQIEGVSLDKYPVPPIPGVGAAEEEVEIAEEEEEEIEEEEATETVAGGSEPQDHAHSPMAEDAALTGDAYLDNLDD